MVFYCLDVSIYLYFDIFVYMKINYLGVKCNYI
jgi:hypothetical protein